MKFWRLYPAIRLLLPFLIGILVSSHFEINSNFPLYLGLFLLFIFGVSFTIYRFKFRYFIGLLMHLILFLIGIQLTTFKTEKYRDNHFSKQISKSDYLQVRIGDRLIEKDNSYKTILEVEKIISNNLSIKTSGKLLTYLRKSNKVLELKYGDILIIKNNINSVSEAKNPYQFDYKYYLDLHQINYQVFLDSNSWQKTSENKANSLVMYSQIMRDKLFAILKENGLKDNQLKVGAALLLGLREQLDKDIIRSYSSAGAMHVLAVSGLHVGILFLILQNLFHFLKRLKYGGIYFSVLIISILWFYALITGLSASVMRASTMFSLIIIGNNIMKQKPSIYNTLAVSAILLLIIDPYVIYQVGFQLSYLAVIGIVYLQPKFVKLIYVPNKLLYNIWSITCVSFAAQIATFPLGLYYFHQFPVYFFISNLIVIPIAVLIFYLGITLFITSFIGGISLVIGKIINWFLWILNQTIYITENLLFSLIEEISITVAETFLLYILIISTILVFYYRKIKMVYIVLFLGVSIISYQLYDNYQSVIQNRITFYSINKQTIFEFVSGKTVYFVSEKEFKNNWNKMLFNVNNNWNKQNITKKVYLNIDSLNHKREYDNLYLNKYLFSFKNKNVLLLNRESSNLYSDLKIDYLIISNKNLNLLNKFLKLNKPKHLIFDSTISSYKMKFWSDKLKNKPIKLFSLAEKYITIEL